jgi:Ca-activated chloride channel family protein
MTARSGEGRAWTAGVVAGGAALVSVVFGLAVALFVWLGDPLRFNDVGAASLVLRGAIGLAWAAGWLSLRWRLRRLPDERRARALETAGLAVAPLGALALAIPLPDSPWVLPFVVGAVAGLTSLAPLLGFAERRALVASVGDARTVEGLLGGLSPSLRLARGALVVVGVSLCVFAAARPQLYQGTRMLSRRGIDIVVALDFSKSMLARDVAPSRIDLAKRELEQFIEGLGGDRVGLVAFAGEAFKFPLTTDYEAATLFWRDLDPYDMPVGGTAIGRALDAALELFENDRLSADRSKVVVLMTDGEDHEGDPVAVARRAAAADVRIHVLGIGGATPELIPVMGADGSWSGFQRDDRGEYVTTALTEENERQLREIAELSGGSYHRAEQGQVGVDHIRREVRRLRQAQLDERRVQVYGEAYQGFLVVGLLVLIVGSAMPRGRPWARAKVER